MSNRKNNSLLLQIKRLKQELKDKNKQIKKLKSLEPEIQYIKVPMYPKIEHTGVEENSMSYINPNMVIHNFKITYPEATI